MDTGQLKHENELLRGENQVCKRKLDSKCEALQILTRDLDRCRQQRDQFKLMAEQVQGRYQALKRQLTGIGPTANHNKAEFSPTRGQNLPHLLNELGETNKMLQFEKDDLAQKLRDAQGDIKILRQQIARQRIGDTDEGVNTRHFPAHEREDLVKQLEASQEKIVQLERDIEQVLDEKQDQETERDVYKTKYESLNRELNRILGGDEHRVFDIDALLNENEFLKERLSSLEEEKQMAQATASKYKSLLDKKKQKGILKVVQTRNIALVINQKQVSELLAAQMSPTPQLVADLQSIAAALLDTVSDKNVALSHQRKTNKVLGHRVAELEERVKTLETSSNHDKTSGLDRLKLDCAEIKRMFSESDHSESDKMSSIDGESKDATPSSSSEATPTHQINTETRVLQNLEVDPFSEETPDLLGDMEYIGIDFVDKERHKVADNLDSICEANTPSAIEPFLDTNKSSSDQFKTSSDHCNGLELNQAAINVSDSEHRNPQIITAENGIHNQEYEANVDELQELVQEMTLKVCDGARAKTNKENTKECQDVLVSQTGAIRNKQSFSNKTPLLKGKETIRDMEDIKLDV